MEKSFICPMCGHEKKIVIADMSKALKPIHYLQMSDVIQFVESVTGVTHSQMMETDRDPKVVNARQLCYYFGYYLTEDKVTKIGLDVSAQGHANALYGKNKITDLVSIKDKDTIEKAEFIRLRMLSVGFDIPELSEMQDKYQRSRAKLCELKNN